MVGMAVARTDSFASAPFGREWRPRTTNPTLFPFSPPLFHPPPSPVLSAFVLAQIVPAMTHDPKATTTTQRMGISTETNSSLMSVTSLSFAAESEMAGIDNTACNFGAAPA